MDLFEYAKTLSTLTYLYLCIGGFSIANMERIGTTGERSYMQFIKCVYSQKWLTSDLITAESEIKKLEEIIKAIKERKSDLLDVEYKNVLIIDRRADICEKNRFTYDIEVIKLPIKYLNATHYELFNGITDREFNPTFGYHVILEREFSKHMYHAAYDKKEGNYLYPDNKAMDKAVLDVLLNEIAGVIKVDIVRFEAFRYVPKKEEKAFYDLPYKEREGKEMPHKTRYEKELKLFCEKAGVQYPYD